MAELKTWVWEVLVASATEECGSRQPPERVMQKGEVADLLFGVRGDDCGLPPSRPGVPLGRPRQAEKRARLADADPELRNDLKLVFFQAISPPSSGGAS